MKTLSFVFKNLLVAALFVAFSGCVSMPPNLYERKHALIGAWKATDGTIFVFRNDGTFHGIDWHHREIWGNWVTLAPNRIGFQSLTHDSYYLPQYAVISDHKNIMNYIITGGKRFIQAERITNIQAADEIEEVLVSKVILPNSEK